MYEHFGKLNKIYILLHMSTDFSKNILFWSYWSVILQIFYQFWNEFNFEVKCLVIFILWVLLTSKYLFFNIFDIYFPVSPVLILKIQVISNSYFFSYLSMCCVWDMFFSGTLFSHFSGADKLGRVSNENKWNVYYKRSLFTFQRKKTQNKICILKWQGNEFKNKIYFLKNIFVKICARYLKLNLDGSIVG